MASHTDADEPTPTPSSPTPTIRKGSTSDSISPSAIKTVDYAAAVKSGLQTPSSSARDLGNGRPVSLVHFVMKGAELSSDYSDTHDAFHVFFGFFGF